MVEGDSEHTAMRKLFSRDIINGITSGTHQTCRETRFVLFWHRKLFLQSRYQDL